MRYLPIEYVNCLWEWHHDHGDCSASLQPLLKQVWYWTKQPYFTQVNMSNISPLISSDVGITEHIVTAAPDPGQSAGISRLLRPYIARVEECVTWSIRCHRSKKRKRLGEVKVSMGFGEPGAGRKKSQGQLFTKTITREGLAQPKKNACIRTNARVIVSFRVHGRESKGCARLQPVGSSAVGKTRLGDKFLCSAFALCRWAPTCLSTHPC